MLLAAYIFNRCICCFGLPSDAQHHTALGHARNLVDICLLGLVQSWFVDLGQTSRLFYVFSRKWLFPLICGAGVTYSLISSIPAIDEAVTEDTVYTAAFIITIGAVASLVLGILGWHVYHASCVFRDRSHLNFYLGMRAFIIVLLTGVYLAIRFEHNEEGPAKLHLHHYFVAWVLSLVASFNHPISVGFLAITAGIFVQGVSVYSSASMFYRGGSEKPCPEVFMS
jgi:hypothetical protein